MLIDTERVEQMVAEATKKRYAPRGERFREYERIKADISELYGGKTCSKYEMAIEKLATALRL